MKIIKYSFSIFLCMISCCAGYFLNVLYEDIQPGGKRILKLLDNRSYVVLEDYPYPDRIKEDFFLTWRNKKGFAAFREICYGIDTVVYSYWVVENGRITKIYEDNKLFPTYDLLDVESVRIGYEKPDGSFVDILSTEKCEQDLKLLVDKTKSNWVKGLSFSEVQTFLRDLK